MKRYHGIRISLFAVMLLALTACNKWLDISSEDRIMENDLFKTQAGFISALNGVYVDLLNDNLYGQTLTCTVFDVLAQYYDCIKEEHAYRDLASYNSQAKSRKTDETWKQAYSLLANIVTIIEHCETNRSVLNDEYYHVILGEAYALRALLQFELLRIWGPVYSQKPTETCIPYMMDTDVKIRALLKASEVADLILTDLKKAETLLQDYDPIITKGIIWSDAGHGNPNDMRYRNMRLNYYAVQALIARVAHYTGNTELALEYAEKVIDETQVQNQWFPWVKRFELTNAGYENRIFSSEVLFGMYDLKRSSHLYTNNFSNTLKTNNVLRLCKSKAIDYLYEGKTDDFRMLQWSTLKGPEDENWDYFVKYIDVDDNKRGYKYIIPLIRISEMYLIAAEIYSEKFDYTSQQLAYQRVNAVRNARGIPDETQNISAVIEAEFRKEFIGEGQMFWYYKRRNSPTIPNGSKPGETIEMQENFYLFTLPASERSERGEKK